MRLARSSASPLARDLRRPFAFRPARSTRLSSGTGISTRLLLVSFTERGRDRRSHHQRATGRDLEMNEKPMKKTKTI